MNPLDLSGRTVMVTGASSGIGRATALLCSRLQARVVLVARNAERLEEARKSLEGTGHIAAVFDLARTDEIPAWFRSVVSESGPLSGVAHAAGIQMTVPLSLMTQARLDEVMRVNLHAAVMLARAFHQRGNYAQPASLVLVSSVMGMTGAPGLSGYGASKGALIGLAKSLALEMARNRIRVNCVSPGYVRSAMANEIQETVGPEQFAAIEAMHPLGLGAADDVAHAIAFLLADTGRWITGSNLVVDGGYTAR